MKKWFLWLLAALLLTCSAVAEEAIEPPRYAPGETVELRLRVTAPGMAGLQLRLAWDPTVMEIAEETPELAAFFSQDAMLSMVYAEPEEGVMTLVWLQAADVSLTDIPVLDFALRIREDAPGGETYITVLDCLLTDMTGAPLRTQAEGMSIIIDAPVSTPELTPELTPEPSPDPTAEPEITPEPCEAFLWISLQEDEELANSVPEQYIPSRPSGSMEMEVVTATPAATPVPTPVTVVIGATPAPVIRQDKLQMRTTRTDDGFRLELVATDVTIGGLQATITYDPSLASCIGAAFADEFLSSAMVKMNHQGEGSIRLVYSSPEGYQAQGEAIFAADFSATQAARITLTLTDVKCTNADAELTMWQQEPQQITLTLTKDGASFIAPKSTKEGAEATCGEDYS